MIVNFVQKLDFLRGMTTPFCTPTCQILRQFCSICALIEVILVRMIFRIFWLHFGLLLTNNYYDNRCRQEITVSPSNVHNSWIRTLTVFQVIWAFFFFLSAKCE